jgi:hypothetical protein
MISAIELALNGLDHAELTERADVLASLVEDGFAFLADQDGHCVLVASPLPTLPPLPWALA